MLFSYALKGQKQQRRATLYGYVNLNQHSIKAIAIALTGR